jgi:hypothetical protein
MSARVPHWKTCEEDRTPRTREELDRVAGLVHLVVFER